MTAAGPPDNGDNDPVALISRWDAAGALWRVVACRGDAVTIALCQCDGGEEVDRITSTDPRLVQFLAGRSSSAD
jgi:hypothetical protein